MDFRFFRNIALVGWGAFYALQFVFAAPTVTSEANLNAQFGVLDERIADIVRANPIDAVMQAKNPADLQRALTTQMEANKAIAVLIENKSALVTAGQEFISTEHASILKNIFKAQANQLNHVNNELRSALRVLDITPQAVADALLATAPADIASRLAEISAEYDVLDTLDRNFKISLPKGSPPDFKAMLSPADFQKTVDALRAAGLDPALYDARGRALQVLGLTEAEFSAMTAGELTDLFNALSKNQKGKLTKFFTGSIQPLHQALNGIRVERDVWQMIAANPAQILTPMNAVAGKVTAFLGKYRDMVSVLLKDRPHVPNIIVTKFSSGAISPRLFIPPLDAKPIPPPLEIFSINPESAKIAAFAKGAGKFASGVVIVTTIGDMVIGTDPEYAMTKYMEAMKQCQTNQTQSFLTALWGRIKQGGVNIGVNIGVDNIVQFLSDGITRGNFNEEIKQAMKDGIAYIKKNCPDILTALHADSHFVNGLAQMGVRTNPLVLQLNSAPSNWRRFAPRTVPPIWIPPFEGVNMP